jgi:histidinol dehydrogenase
MLGIPARIAGCEEVILCTPPDKDGNVHPAILFAAQIAGIRHIYKVGGAQAIAAMAYGTQEIPKVDKIFGPGNQYVTAAKQLAQLEGVAIDMPAGPSEVLVIADESAPAAFVAADLLSQAEHGPDSQVVLITWHEPFIHAVQLELDSQLAVLPRKDTAKEALRHSKIFLVKDAEEAMELSNAYAPEHLILAVAAPEALATKVRQAGSVFLGYYTPESAGDYASGTNHTLPTNGFARSYSGVSVDSFVKKVTFQHITQAGLENLGPTVETLAEAEHLDAHARAVKVRRG